jgi:DcuC family C4-dicarboxylate transporter
MILLAILVIAAGIYAVYRRVDVRLALLLTSLVLATLAGDPAAIVRMFLATFSNERFVVPICTAMGFAYVLKQTGCDEHLVHLLVKPLTHVRPLLVPGTVCVGFLVNIPIVSQSSTAVTLGSVVIPVLAAARVPAVTIGAALLLGSSIGGELLNPGAPELRTVVQESGKAATALHLPSPGRSEDVVSHILPLNLLGLAVATLLLWSLSFRDGKAPEDPAAVGTPGFGINPFKALIPLLPLVLLFLTAMPRRPLEVPPNWLVEVKAGATLTTDEQGLFDSRLIGAAMLIGVVVAGLSAPRQSLKAAGSFFEGAGFGFTHIISLIVTANCFGKAVELVGLARVFGDLINAYPVLLMPLAGLMALSFGSLCGSGMATTQSLFPFFAGPALELGIDPYLAGAIVSLASAAGRTVSPFAAVTLMSAQLTKTSPIQLIARVAPAAVAAVVIEVIVAMLVAWW